MSELNESRNESVADGLVDAVAEANREARPERAATDPAATGASGAQNAHTSTQTQKQEKKNEAVAEEDDSDNADGEDTQDYSREIPTKAEEPTETTTTTEEPSQSTTEVTEEWYKDLPAAPGEFEIQPPEPDELGQVDPNAVYDYLGQKFKHDQKVEAYNNAYITKSFEAAEAVLPELKTNKALQQMVKQTFISDPTNPANHPIEIAKGLSEAFSAKASEGANNAKTQITIQKAATVEKTGASKPKSSPKKDENFERRLAKNDSSAFEELIGGWIDQGKV